MPIKKEISYGYYVVDSAGESQIIKPSNLTKIHLTSINSKFLFYGTRHDILKWMSLHSELLVESEPLDKDNDEPPSSPSLLLSEDPETLVSSPTSITSSMSPMSTSTSATSKKSHDIVFDLFTIPVETSSILSEETTFNKPLNIVLKCIPWIEVMLEVRPVDERKDSKLHPIHRVILPSGSSLSEISKALEKSWKSLIPDSTAFDPDCFIRNSELIYPQNKSKSGSHDMTTKSVNSDNDKSYKFVNEIAKHVPTVDLWLRQKQTSGAIPPGVLTPYIIDDILEDLGDEKKEEEFVNKKILIDKKKEAEMDKELIQPDLPKYETTFGDVLLERGKV